MLDASKNFFFSDAVGFLSPSFLVPVKCLVKIPFVVKKTGVNTPKITGIHEGKGPDPFFLSLIGYSIGFFCSSLTFLGSIILAIDSITVQTTIETVPTTWNHLSF